MAGRTPTIQLGTLTGVWSAVYRERDRLEAAADRSAITAWQRLVRDLDLGDVVATVQQSSQNKGGDQAAVAARRRHLQQVTAAAVLGRLNTLTRHSTWPDLIAALAAALSRAQAVGQRAGHAVVDDDEDGLADDGDDQDDGHAAGAAQATASAYDVAAAALKELAATVARQLLAAVAAGESSTALAELVAGAVRAALAWTLVLSTAIGVAFNTGMRAAYATREVVQFDFVTAGDSSVCTTCADAEDGNPYSAGDLPMPPLHPNCRCSTQPAQPGSED